jgi:hypothetical protein
LGNGSEGFIAGSKDGLVSLRELAEESHTFGSVGDGGCDSDETSQVGSTIISYLLKKVKEELTSMHQ